MDAGFLKEDCGMVVVNSSSNFVRRENAGRTGYSWSVIMMAEEGKSARRLYMKSRSLLDLQAALHHPCCRHGRCSCSLVHSVAGLEEFSLRPSWRRKLRIRRRNPSDRRRN